MMNPARPIQIDRQIERWRNKREMARDPPLIPTDASHSSRFATQSGTCAALGRELYVTPLSYVQATKAFELWPQTYEFSFKAQRNLRKIFSAQRTQDIHVSKLSYVFNNIGKSCFLTTLFPHVCFARSSQRSYWHSEFTQPKYNIIGETTAQATRCCRICLNSLADFFTSPTKHCIRTPPPRYYFTHPRYKLGFHVPKCKEGRGMCEWTAVQFSLLVQRSLIKTRTFSFSLTRWRVDLSKHPRRRHPTPFKSHFQLETANFHLPNVIIWVIWIGITVWAIAIATATFQLKQTDIWWGFTGLINLIPILLINKCDVTRMTRL